jgi:hypothetical protein
VVEMECLPPRQCCLWKDTQDGNSLSHHSDLSCPDDSFLLEPALRHSRGRERGRGRASVRVIRTAGTSTRLLSPPRSVCSSVVCLIELSGRSIEEEVEEEVEVEVTVVSGREVKSLENTMTALRSSHPSISALSLSPSPSPSPLVRARCLLTPI